MRFVQVDSLSFSKNTKPQTLKIINDINKTRNIDFIVFSGNNIAKPDQNNLKELVKITKDIKTPCYFVLGNKDVNKQKHFGKTEYFNYLQKKVKAHKRIKNPNYVFEKNDIIFIVLDGSKEFIPSSMGYYKSETLTWLDKQLTNNKDKKVIIIQHFPVIPPSKRESRYTYKAEEYLKVLENHNNVKAIFSGHFNVNKEQELNNILHVSTADAPKYRIIDILDYETENPIFWSTIK